MLEMKKEQKWISLPYLILLPKKLILPVNINADFYHNSEYVNDKTLFFMQKTEGESKHLTLELCDKVVEFLPGDLKKFQGELTQPAETNECLAKSENMQVASNNGVKTMNTVSEGNPEISKGESFLISPEISKVANETCGMSEHTEVDDTPFKAEKIAKDEDKMVNDKKFQLEEEVGTGGNEAKAATEDRMEKGNTDHSIEELNLDIGGGKRIEVEVIADQDSSLEEKCGSIEEETSRSQESENEGTKTDENADIEFNKQEANIELKKQASIDSPDPIIDSLKKANETVTEDVEQKNLEEDTNKVQTTLLTETMEEKSIEENTAAMMSTKEVSRLYDSLFFELFTYSIFLHSNFHQQKWHKQSLLAHTCTQCETAQPESLIPHQKGSAFSIFFALSYFNSKRLVHLIQATDEV